MSNDLQVFDEETTELAIAPDDDMGVNEDTMPTIVCDCIASGNAQKPKQHGADPHAKNCAVYGGGTATKSVMEVQLEPAPLPLMQVLPADFRLPALIKFCPNPAVQEAIHTAATYAVNLQVTGPEGLAAADLALQAVNDSLKAADAEFEDAASLANEVHKGITSTRAGWKAPGEFAKKTLGSRMYAEKARLDKIAADERRRQQEEANRLAREEAAAQVAAAKKNQAPPAVVKQLEQRVETAVAPPVPVAAVAPALKSSTTVTTWKARIKGTPADNPPNPAMEVLCPVEWDAIAQLLRDVADGKAPRACFEINWSYLNSRAKSDKSTLTITGIEAFAEGSVRAKGSRGR